MYTGAEFYSGSRSLGREFRLANSHGAKVKLMVFTVNLPEVPEILGNI